MVCESEKGVTSGPRLYFRNQDQIKVNKNALNQFYQVI